MRLKKENRRGAGNTKATHETNLGMTNYLRIADLVNGVALKFLSLGYMGPVATALLTVAGGAL